MKVEKTFVLKGKIESKWLLLDAANKNLGRFSSEIAKLLLGKHKPTYTPGVSMGDYVVVINASQLDISQKRLDEKIYYRHSNYPGGLKAVRMRDMMNNHPDRVIRKAVWGMLPHNKIGRKLIKRLRIYSGSDHPHAGQKLKAIKVLSKGV
ncbi:MAG TPA: 50S ribosomal protein L13 [Anaerolineae bacterium]|nr:50S ribosomal protein L13 [Anaerolineae bacterium]